MQVSDIVMHKDIHEVKRAQATEGRHSFRVVRGGGRGRGGARGSGRGQDVQVHREGRKEGESPEGGAGVAIQRERLTQAMRNAQPHQGGQAFALMPVWTGAGAR